MGCCKRQAFDAQVVGDDLCESKLELLKIILRDYREVIRRCVIVERDQGCFICGQRLDFLYRLFRPFKVRDVLPGETDWDGLLKFGFTNVQLLSVSQFIVKTGFRTKAMRAAKGHISVEREKSKETKTYTIASAVMGDMSNPHIDQRIAYIRFACMELLRYPNFKSELVVRITCFEYSFFFTFPRSPAEGFFSRFIQSFCVCSWLSRELKIIHMDDCPEFIDDQRFAYLDEQQIGPKIEDMVTFLSSSPELSRRGYTSYVFNCAAYVWDMWYQSCRKFHWVVLMAKP